MKQYAINMYQTPLKRKYSYVYVPMKTTHNLRERLIEEEPKTANNIRNPTFLAAYKI